MTVKDDGSRVVFETGSNRSDATGKGRFDLVPAYPLKRLAIHYENGAHHHGDRDWEKGQPLRRLMHSTFSHLNAFMDGDKSEDHLAAAIWNLFGYVWTEREVLAGRLPTSLADGCPWHSQAEAPPKP